MVSAKATIVSLAAAAGLIQMCPAPPAVVAAVWGGVAGGVVAGGIGAGATMCLKYCPGGKAKRTFAYYNRLTGRDLPPGVSQESIDQCTGQLNDNKAKGILIEMNNVDDTTVDISHLPPACMNLATVLTGNPAQAGGPVPIPMGSDKIQYQGLSPQDRQNLAAALGGA